MPDDERFVQSKHVTIFNSCYTNTSVQFRSNPFVQTTKAKQKLEIWVFVAFYGRDNVKRKSVCIKNSNKTRVAEKKQTKNGRYI